MFVLLIVLTAALLFLGVVPMGVLITSQLTRQLSIDSPIELAVFCIFFGLTWCTAWLYVILIGPFDHSNVSYLLGVKLFIDSFALADAVKKYYRHLWRNITGLRLTINVLGTAYAISFGVIGMLFYPMSTDNAALYWLARQVAYGSFELSGAQGSPFYLAWLLSPAVLLRDLFVTGNIAAVLKIASSLFLWLMSVFFVERVLGRRMQVFALVIFSFALASFIGDYGLFKTAKETPIGMLFLIGFFAQTYVCWDIGEDNRSIGNFVMLGVLAALAIGFAAVTVPYLALLLSIMALGGAIGARAGIWTLVCGALVIPFSLSSMLEISLGWGVLGYSMTLGLIALAYSKGRVFFSILERHKPLVATFLGISVILASAYLSFTMPLKYNALPYWPLDGKAEFHDLINDLPWLKELGVVGMIGILLMFARSVRERRCSLILFVGFPWFALALIFLVASFQDLPLSLPPQHVWDLAKDVPNWWLGIYYAIGVAWLIHELAVLAEKAFTGLNETALRSGFTGVCIVTAGFMLALPFQTYLVTDQPAFQSGAVFHEKPDVAKAINLIQLTRRVDQVGRTKVSKDKIFISDGDVHLWNEDGVDRRARLGWRYSSSELQAIGINPVMFRPAELEWLDSIPDGVSELVLMEKGLEKIILPRRGGQKVGDVNDTTALYLVGIPDNARLSLGSNNASKIAVSPLY